MGSDLVDDLHQAEDLIGRLARLQFHDLTTAAELTKMAREYCRLTCDPWADGTPCDEDCGCPCHRRPNPCCRREGDEDADVRDGQGGIRVGESGAS